MGIEYDVVDIQTKRYFELGKAPWGRIFGGCVSESGVPVPSFDSEADLAAALAPEWSDYWTPDDDTPGYLREIAAKLWPFLVSCEGRARMVCDAHCDVTPLEDDGWIMVGTAYRNDGANTLTIRAEEMDDLLVEAEVLDRLPRDDGGTIEVMLFERYGEHWVFESHNRDDGALETKEAEAYRVVRRPETGRRWVQAGSGPFPSSEYLVRADESKR